MAAIIIVWLLSVSCSVLLFVSIGFSVMVVWSRSVPVAVLLSVVVPKLFVIFAVIVNGLFSVAPRFLS